MGDEKHSTKSEQHGTWSEFVNIEPDTDITLVEELKAAVHNLISQIAWMVMGLLVVFLPRLGRGYRKWGQEDTAEAKQKKRWSCAN